MMWPTNVFSGEASTPEVREHLRPHEWGRCTQECVRHEFSRRRGNGRPGAFDTANACRIFARCWADGKRAAAPTDGWAD
jgi:hypothetical protein